MNWNERIVAISVNPEMATVADIAKLAADFIDANKNRQQLRNELEDAVKTIESNLNPYSRLQYAKRLLKAVRDKS